MTVSCRNGRSFFRGYVCSESVSKTNYILFPLARISGSRNQGVKTRVAPLTITSSNPSAKVLLLVPVTLHSLVVEVLVPERECCYRSCNNDSIDLEVKNATWPLWPFSCLRLNTTRIAGLIDSYYQGELGLLLHNGDKV